MGNTKLIENQEEKSIGKVEKSSHKVYQMWVSDGSPDQSTVMLCTTPGLL